jgi:integrase/recombinase XerD
MMTPAAAILPTSATFAVGPLWTPHPAAARRVLEFFTANIRNPHTRRAYLGAISRFSDWCPVPLEAVTPVHVAAFIEDLSKTHSKPTVKQHLAALRMLFDWLVTGGILPQNPASSVRGPRHSIRRGMTPVLSSDEVRQLLDSIPTGTAAGLRDRALIAVMAYTFARIGAVLTLRRADYFQQKGGPWLRLHEKNGNLIDFPCHPGLDQSLQAWLAALRPATADAPLFPSLKNPARPLAQSEVYRMITRRASAAGIPTRICCHTFRATGITTYLQNGGRLETAQRMAGHESPRTTALYDRRDDALSPNEVSRLAY